MVIPGEAVVVRQVIMRWECCTRKVALQGGGDIVCVAIFEMIMNEVRGMFEQEHNCT